MSVRCRKLSRFRNEIITEWINFETFYHWTTPSTQQRLFNKVFTPVINNYFYRRTSGIEVYIHVGSIY